MTDNYCCRNDDVFILSGLYHPKVNSRSTKDKMHQNRIEGAGKLKIFHSEFGQRSRRQWNSWRTPKEFQSNLDYPSKNSSIS